MTEALSKSVVMVVEASNLANTLCAMVASSQKLGEPPRSALTAALSHCTSAPGGGGVGRVVPEVGRAAQVGLDCGLVPLHQRAGVVVLVQQAQRVAELV